MSIVKERKRPKEKNLIFPIVDGKKNEQGGIEHNPEQHMQGNKPKR